ncbi:MAG TPA: xanthine dehydrogenase family protein molybdopterin-binding subunit [Gaiellaceae bacterium]|nr:xanthine dehydrogenase family protein molybdopterin-binding subunit [Gaiellaceae bacterium]
MTGFVGQRVLRKEDPRFLLGEGRYVDNLDLEGALRVVFVRSLVPYARINGIDTSMVEGARVLTADDVGIEPLVPHYPGIETRMERPPVARDVVRFAGEIVAVVLADTQRDAVDAAELVFVDYDPLPVVVDPAAALAGEPYLYPELGTNVCAHIEGGLEDGDSFAGCEIVATGRITSQRMAPAPLEPRSSAARVDDEGRLNVWLSTQTPHSDRDGIAKALGLEPSDVRVIARDVGGGFGAKTLSTEDIIVSRLARETGRPVRWTETRSESMLAIGHCRAQIMDFTIGGSRDGKIEAFKLEVLHEAGAYPNVGAFLPMLTRWMQSGVYAIPKLAYVSNSVVTNTSFTTAFRGAGRPEAAQAIERAVDAFAAEAGLDPADVRRKNFIGADAFPFQTASGTTYDSGDYAPALERALEAVGYDELRAEQARLRQDGGPKQLGIGLSVYVEVTNGGAEPEFGAVEITPEGRAILRTGSFAHGQGHETSYAQIVADRLGLDLDAVTVVAGDTDDVARGGGTYGSKSLQIGGTAAAQASTEVVERAKQIVAEELEANPADVVLDLDGGRFHITGAPVPSLTWAELAARLAADDRLGELHVEHDFKPESGTFPFGAHVAVVRVDTETGGVELERLVAVDDAGRIISPVLAEGQRHGGIGSGVGQALFEEFRYDEDGNPLSGSFLTYPFPSAAELPSFELVPMETPTPMNELGAKGIGESGTIGATPAVQNAVVDALLPLGVRHVEMPANGENVWRAIQAASS